MANLALLSVPTFGKVSSRWTQMYAHKSVPLGAVVCDFFDPSPDSIAAKRNRAIEYAITHGMKTLIFLGDDVIPPTNFILLLLQRWQQGAKAVTGMYWTKGHPPQPYVWRGYMDEPFYNWKAGEYLPVDLAGCDCLLLDVEMLKKMGGPWFSLDYNLGMHGDRTSEKIGDTEVAGRGFQHTTTEDFFFFTRVKEHGVQLMCDTGIQCLHEDRETGVCWGLTQNMPQYSGVPIADKGLLIADIGCGDTPNPLAQQNKVLRYDGDEACKPDMICDIRSIPEEDNVFDMALASHVLEHLPMRDTEAAVREWLRIVKPGGKLVIRVPNLQYACRKVANGEQTFDYQQDGITMQYHHLMIYGLQSTPGQFHMNGFTQDSLMKLAVATGGKGSEVILEHTNPDNKGEGTELSLTIIKHAAVVPKNIQSSWTPEVARTEPQAPPVLNGSEQAPARKRRAKAS